MNKSKSKLKRALRKRPVQILLVFLLAFLCLSVFQFSTPNIIGNDGYFHIKFAEITAEKGLIKSFPWMYHTDWRQSFADSHFLYHIFLVPFTLFGLVLGAKLSAVFFGALLITCFFYVLKKSKIRYAPFWTFLLVIISHTFLFDIGLPRAPALAATILITGLYFLFRSNRKGIFATAALFTLTYTAWPILFAFYVIYAFFQWLVDKIIDLKLELSLIAGVLVGLIINPYFPKNLAVFKLQIVNILLKSDAGQTMDMIPYSGVTAFFRSLWPVLALILISVGLLAENKNARTSRNLSLLFFTALLTALTFQSKRYLIYCVPVALITFAFIFNDASGKLISKFKSLNLPSKRIIITLFLAFLILLSITVTVRTINNNTKYSEFPAPYTNEGCGSWLENNTAKKEIIAARWDHFPGLFFYNTHNYYVNALHPAYLYYYDKEKHESALNIFHRYELGSIRDDLNNLNSRTVVLSNKLDPKRYEFFENEYEKLGLVKSYQDGYCAVYQLEDRL